MKNKNSCARQGMSLKAPALVTPRRQPLAAAVALALSLSISQAMAATINVDTANDSENLDGLCTLREAILNANGDMNVGVGGNDCEAGSGPDTIDLSAIANETMVLLGVELGPITSDITIQGANVTINGDGSSRVFNVQGDTAVPGPDVTLTLENLTLTGGDGGASFPEFGGAIKVSDGALVLRNSDITNSSSYAGGAIGASESLVTIYDSNLNGNSAYSGGAIICFDGIGTKIYSSSLFDNEADKWGGAMQFRFCEDVLLDNSTISGNTASQGSILLGDSTMSMVNSTLSDNSDGIYKAYSTLTLTNSILANSMGFADCTQRYYDYGKVYLQGSNLIEVNACDLPPSPPNLLTSDPALATLQDNGGRTPTHEPLGGSPVIDAGDNSYAGAYDQRGDARIFNGTIDLGSVEFNKVAQAGPDFIVTVKDDIDDGVCEAAPGHCSLREAIIAAEDDPDPSTVSFLEGLPLLPDPTITLTGTALPTIGSEVTIQGAGFTVDANNLTNHFNISGENATVTLQSLTLTNATETLRASVTLGDKSRTVLENMRFIYNWTGGLYAEDSTVSVIDSEFTSNQGPGIEFYFVTGTLENTHIANNFHFFGTGAGILSRFSTLSINQSHLYSNSAGGPGGGIYSLYGSLSIENSEISDNSAGPDPVRDLGGGIYIRSDGTTTITNSTLSENSSPAKGGGIAQVGGNLLITNSTISHNTAPLGAAIYVNEALVSEYNTIANNFVTGSGTGSGAVYLNDAYFALRGSILADTFGGDDCAHNAVANAISGPSIVENSGNCFQFETPLILRVDPRLGPLRDNGGPTKTHALRSTSPAIDQFGVFEPGPFDQRGPGFSRQVNGQQDIGAFEVQETGQLGPNFVVTSDDNVDDGFCAVAPGHCSLREAIIEANFDPDVTTISFSAELQSPTPATINLAGVHLPKISSAITIQGSGITIDANGSGRHFDLREGAPDLTLESLVLSNGSTPFRGGSIYAVDGGVSLSRVTLENNQADDSGGAIISFGNLVTITDSIFSGNSSGLEGGALSLQGSTATISGSTFYGNEAKRGGALRSNQMVLTISNSTLSENMASDNGGAISTYAGFLTLEQSTIAGNTSANAGSGLVLDNNATVVMRNSVIADGAGDFACFVNGYGGQSIYFEGGNIVESFNHICAADFDSGVIEADPLLHPVFDFGGSTPTMKPLAGSPVIDAGDDTVVTGGLTTDQRGNPRIAGRGVEIGAFELQGGVLSLEPEMLTVNEGGGVAVLSVTRSGGTEGTVRTTPELLPGTAISGEDFSGLFSEIVFEDGESGSILTGVTIVNDDVFEPTEQFQLRLSCFPRTEDFTCPTGGAAIGNEVSTIEITDDDTPPANGVIAIDPASVVVDETAGTVTLKVTRTEGTDGAVSVTVDTMDDTATAGDDYTAITGQVLNFADGGSGSQDVVVTLIDDGDLEENEVFRVVLSNPTGGAVLLGTGISQVTIKDDEKAAFDLIFEDSLESEP